MTTSGSLSLSGSDWFCGAATGCVSDGPSHRSDTACRGASQIEEWLPATVPGDVHLALLAAGRIPDPFFGQNNEENRWVDELDWWFKKDFDLEPLAGRRAFLVFAGIDYIADTYLNGVKLGHHEGMFGRQVYEVTEVVRTGNEEGKRGNGGYRNTVVVKLQAAKDLPKVSLSFRDRVGKWLAKKLLCADLFPDRLATLKCQMSYGWDFAPRLLTAGIWDDVHLHLCDMVYIEDVFVHTELDRREAVVRVSVDLESVVTLHNCELWATVEGANFASAPVVFRQQLVLPRGKSTHELSFRLDLPRLWQPWDRGEPNLYRLRLEVRGGDRAVAAGEGREVPHLEEPLRSSLFPQ